MSSAPPQKSFNTASKNIGLAPNFLQFVVYSLLNVPARLALARFVGPSRQCGRWLAGGCVMGAAVAVNRGNVASARLSALCARCLFLAALSLHPVVALHVVIVTV